MSRRRSKLLIVMEILEILSREDIAPTRLATLVNMPYDRLIKLLRELESRKLIEIVDGDHSKIAVLTDRGFRLLEELRRIKNILNEYGLL